MEFEKAQLSVNELPDEQRGKISDGYHSFDELYEHRITLYIALCKVLHNDGILVWKSKKHHDGSEYEGWFLLGMFDKPGKQITYHLPLSKWDDIRCKVLDQAPEFDGHTSADVLERIKKLLI